MSELIYFICAGASAFCAFLLIRGYFRRRTRLLFWSSVYFCGQTIANLLLVLDLVVFPDVNMALARRVVAVVTTGLFLFALIAEVEA
jgi:hypothetical protein